MLHALTQGDVTMRVFIAAMLASGLIAQSAQAQPTAAGPANAANRHSCASEPAWTAPQAPFRIYGNTWFVGPRGLGVFLVTAPTGDVLIDGGVPEDAPLIEANLRALGIKRQDVR
jgi:metallo-beta-lactamase class B